MDGDDDDATQLQAFPTDARQRQKEQEARDREAGTLQAKRKAGKRKFQVEDHFDDCGEDLSSIGGEQDIELYVEQIIVDDMNFYAYDLDTQLMYDDLDELPRFMFWTDQRVLPRALNEGVTSTDSIAKLLVLLARIAAVLQASLTLWKLLVAVACARKSPYVDD